jgi:hypothetical protein
MSATWSSTSTRRPGGHRAAEPDPTGDNDRPSGRGVGSRSRPSVSVRTREARPDSPRLRPQPKRRPTPVFERPWGFGRVLKEWVLMARSHFHGEEEEGGQEEGRQEEGRQEEEGQALGLRQARRPCGVRLAGSSSLSRVRLWPDALARSDEKGRPGPLGARAGLIF